MLNTHKDWMAGKSATANNKDDLIRLIGLTGDTCSTINLCKHPDELRKR